ncbi:hypothetical protein HDU78_011812 [Chytriomyces hyalinus]|nr:hypothetical protein HDU78_011812 [Chytriomyces hyalinus]
MSKIASLSRILDDETEDSDLVMVDGADALAAEEEDDEKDRQRETEREHARQRAGFCVECEDQPASLLCKTCADAFCEVCFHSQHRKGSRKQHLSTPIPHDDVKNELKKPRAVNRTGAGASVRIPLNPDKKSANNSNALLNASASSTNAAALLSSLKNAAEVDSDDEDGEEEEEEEDADMLDEDEAPAKKSKPSKGLDLSLTGTDVANNVAGGKVKVGDWYIDRAKYIPVRLTLSERKYLRLLEAALNVSEYTDKIDILSYANKTRRQVAQIQELCAIISGLVLASDYKTGQNLFKERNFEDNAEFFRDIFELGRRHKIMNPEKMRNVYGKLIYILQDSQIPEVKDMLSFSLVSPIKTVYHVLQAGGALDVLEDDLIVAATKEILSTREGGGSRMQIKNEIKAKERAIEVLGQRYATKEISADGIKQCLYSIGDNHAFLRTNRDPCDKMIGYLKDNFKPDKGEGAFSLAIHAGREGARLSHDHKKQYNYALQSLTLWREILHDMFMLWMLSEGDLLSDENMYRLRDTGQGLNRMQAAPKASRLMHTILHRAQQKVGYWVGSSVIHMGDTNVPNALMFIDKYTQIYRILLPIVRCLEAIDELSENNGGIRRYFDSEFKGPENLKMLILSDFFRHAFDGSGADNFFSAGSCIDGRLTSAWNWCSTIEKKNYFPVFLLSGFVGFDGEGFSS